MSDWPVCGRSGCLGVRRDGQEGCLAHVGAETRKTILAALRPGADLDLRGTPMDGELLDQLLAALRPEDGPPTLGDAQFDRAQFREDAWFDGAQFRGAAAFDEAQFSGAAGFHETRFKQAGTFGPVMAVSALGFERATFEEHITIEAVGPELSCVGTRFAQAATLRLRRTQVVLDGAVFAKPSTIAFASDPFTHYDPSAGREVESFGEGPVAQVDGGRRSRPRLLSLRGVDVATLTLSDLDLAACLFQGAHHLDALRIEGARPFADSPGAWRLRFGRWWYRCGGGGRGGKPWPRSITGAASLLLL